MIGVDTALDYPPPLQIRDPAATGLERLFGKLRSHIESFYQTARVVPPFTNNISPAPPRSSKPSTKSSLCPPVLVLTTPRIYHCKYTWPTEMSSDPATNRATEKELTQPVQTETALPSDEKGESLDEKYAEHAAESDGNLVYEDDDEEPELHARTYIALFSMFLLNYVQVLALQGPPAIVSGHQRFLLGRPLLTDVALLHRKESRQPSSPDMGPQFAFTRPGGLGSSRLIRIRYLSSTEAYPNRLLSCLSRRFSHRTGLSRHLQTYRGTDADRSGFCCCPSGILRPK